MKTPDEEVRADEIRRANRAAEEAFLHAEETHSDDGGRWPDASIQSDYLRAIAAELRAARIARVFGEIS